MIPREPASRRHCLAGLLAAVGAALDGPFLRFVAPGSPAIPAPALVAVLHDPPRARAIGHAYLRSLPAAQRKAGHLVRAIYADLAQDPGFPAPNLSRLINDRVRRDFSAGAVVAVDGWVLSSTEARLYALAALA